MNPLTAGMGARFFAPRRICAVCGRECDADGSPVVAELDPEVSASGEGLSLLVDVEPGEQLVVCEDCRTT